MITDPVAAPPIAGRSAAVSRHGMVATSQPLATLAALDVLRDGGTAADAAIAANAMLTVVEPMSCGLGGDMFALYWDANAGQLHGLNASGRSPFQLDIDTLTQRGYEQIPVRSIDSWSVPGCVDGWAQLAHRFGAKPFGSMLAPAIAAAEQGFAVTPIIARDWAAAAKMLAGEPNAAATFLPGGRAPRVGEVFTSPKLARTLRLVADGGPEAFYRGPIAEQIVAYSRAHGGFLEPADFHEHRSDWIEPVSTTYRGVELFELPPSGQGIAALQMLNLLEAYDLRSLGPAHPDYAHLLVEAKKLTYADRARFYADPVFADLPVDALISKRYADERRELIDPNRARTDVPHGDPALAHGDTVYLSVVDAQGNCCSCIQSIYLGFGSAIVPGEVGFAMQNRGSLFALDPAHPNRLEPHKRPFHTIIPALAMREGKPWLCFGVMGGDMQPQGHTQILVNMIDFDMDVQAAGEAPRIQHSGSATPTGEPAASDGGSVSLERGFSDAVARELERRGHRVTTGAWGHGGYQAVMLDHVNATLHGGSDPRKDGCAMGY